MMCFLKKAACCLNKKAQRCCAEYMNLNQETCKSPESQRKEEYIRRFTFFIIIIHMFISFDQRGKEGEGKSVSPKVCGRTVFWRDVRLAGRTGEFNVHQDTELGGTQASVCVCVYVVSVGAEQTPEICHHKVLPPEADPLLSTSL